jgi:diguanylate cyclase (GGDEF)-like protein
LLIDLDHFRRVNDFYGYRTGDEVIRIIANVIKNNIRRSDVIGRFGGEEIIVFLPHTKLEGAMVAAERIRRIISESEITFEEDQIDITASIGAVSTGMEIKDIEQLIQAASSALDMARDRGRDFVECLPQLPQESTIAPEIIEVQPR